MTKIYILRGLPGSGKTTKAEEMREADPSIVIINKSKLREMLFGDNADEYNTDLEHWEGENEINLRIARRALIKVFVRANRNIVIDSLNGDQDKLRHLKGFCQDYGIVEMIELDTDLKTCIERDSKRKEPLGAEKITNIYNNYFKE